MNIYQAIEAFNERAPVGTRAVYWPTVGVNGIIMHKGGKRTNTRSEAFLSKSGHPVVFLEGIDSYVHINHVDLSGLIYIGGHCFDADFKHRWPRNQAGTGKNDVTY